MKTFTTFRNLMETITEWKKKNKNKNKIKASSIGSQMFPIQLISLILGNKKKSINLFIQQRHIYYDSANLV